MECASGDTIDTSLAPDASGALLSVDDVFRTLPTRSGDVGYPTVKLTAGECRRLSRRLMELSALIENGPGR